MHCKVIDSLAEVPAAAWNRLNTDAYPFLRHEFLYALERNRCLDEATGWYSQHLVVYGDDQQLLGAMPLYMKDNSFGEFVFDWSWADAYQRHGLAYYPKLVSAIPFTPATGPRLLCAPGADYQQVATCLIEAALQLARQQDCSSLHCLFTTTQDQTVLKQQGLLTRVGCQFHWHNQAFESFDQFLATLNAKRRKNIRRERRLVQETAIELSVTTGDQLSEADWVALHQFYSNTFYERGRRPPLTLAFFQELGQSMGEQMVLAFAGKAGQRVAGAISFCSDTTLYGRHWGCRADYDSLHFEVCYYQNIEYCIAHGIQCFEPGAQGEHKIWRGFLPTLTYSAHWIAHPDFAAAIADFLRRETPAVEQYASELNEHSPYRQYPNLDLSLLAE